MRNQNQRFFLLQRKCQVVKWCPTTLSTQHAQYKDIYLPMHFVAYLVDQPREDSNWGNDNQKSQTNSQYKKWQSSFLHVPFKLKLTFPSKTCCNTPLTISTHSGHFGGYVKLKLKHILPQNCHVPMICWPKADNHIRQDFRGYNQDGSNLPKF